MAFFFLLQKYFKKHKKHLLITIKLQNKYNNTKKHYKNVTKILQKVKKCYIIEKNGASLDNIMHNKKV